MGKKKPSDENGGATAPYSVSVQLMYEFEKLREQLQALDALDDNTRDDMTAARVEFDMLSRRYDMRMTDTARQRRETEARFYNIRDQLGELLGQVKTNACVTVGDCAPMRHR